MFLSYFVKKHYRARHLILKELFIYDDKFLPSAPGSEKLLHFDKIAEELRMYERGFILDNLDYLQRIGEIACTQNHDKSSFLIKGVGRDSYIENKYIKEGIKDRLNLFYDFLKNISTIILLIIAIYTFLVNIFQTQKNKSDIERLQIQLEQLSKVSINVPPNTARDTILTVNSNKRNKDIDVQKDSTITTPFK